MTVLPRARTDRAISRRAGGAWLGLVAIALTGCGRPDPAPAPGASFTMRERVAALALRQSGFGSISVIPVRFEHSRIAGPFEDDGRTLYCVSARMMGRRFLKGEKAKAVIREEAGKLSILEDAEEVCEGHKTEPFKELEALGNAKG
ncbi:MULTISPECIES: hypothetical protein [unclassified Methylobacterium]|uniref:hypothetical protein n=1 Tax=unclassified Methylobacterium TaxID=2615210 RepID=UPI00035D3E5E|nr:MULTISPECIES: hypothetical protein [unclassified Methylobacterium]KQP41760.1 hypothetical protein ASF34_08360 [Methylobacterium sp. Leaf106]